jgi:predicted DNA-binding transcriptional regulator AlpA
MDEAEGGLEMRPPTEQNVPQSGTPINNQACDTRAAAALLGLAEQTLRKLRSTGGGPPFVKLGRAVRYRPSDLEAWLSARVMTCTSERQEGSL